jgi:hypothetical protein
MAKGKVSYKACFHDLPMGLQTHIYAPTGLDIREKWSIGGSMPGELPEPRELGLDLPASGLYIREDCDMRCNRFLASFVRKNLDAAHKTLVERILKKAQRIEQHRETQSHLSYSMSTKTPSAFQPGSHMAHSQIPLSPTLQSPTANGPSLADHPAFRNPGQNMSWSSSQSTATSSLRKPLPPTKNFVAELEGDYTHAQAPPVDHRQSMVSELTGSDVVVGNSSSNPSERASMASSDQYGRYSYHYNPADYAPVQQRNDGRTNRISELPAGAQQIQYR